MLTAVSYPQSITWQERESSIQKLPDDTSKVNTWNRLAADIRFQDPSKAIEYLQAAVALAEKLDYKYGLAFAYTHRAELLFYETKLDSANYLLNRAQVLVASNEEDASKRLLAVITQRQASIYHQKQQYDSAVLTYQQAAVGFIKLNDPTKAIFCYYNLSNIYNSLSDTANALLYARQTFRIARQTGDSTYLLRAYMALADAHVGCKNFDSVYHFSKYALPIAYRQKNLFPIGKFQSLLGLYFADKKQYDSALSYFTSALEAYKPINLGYEVSYTLYQIGHTYLQSKTYATAINFLEKAAEESKQYGLDQVLRLCLTDLVEAEEKRGNFAKSLQYLKQYVVVNDTVLQRNNRKTVYDLEVRYQTQKKDAQLLLQQNQLKQKSLLNYLFAGAIASAVIIAFFMYYTFDQRKRLQEKRITELENEKMLSASEAVIRGQEEERGRLAKDLHDGLGGLLSGVKFSLTNMKSNVVLDADSALKFERSLDMLDNSIAELRRVAHNMMPEVLVTFGLAEAVKSYCDSVHQSGIFQVSFQQVGEIKRLSANTEIILYRIVQELLNNVAKHAQARQVLVQLSVHGTNLDVTVEDDGKGMDPSLLTDTKGAGWINIRSRIDYLKGKLDLQTAPGKGTSVHFTVPV
jgi:signal transduction histidine kinase